MHSKLPAETNLADGELLRVMANKEEFLIITRQKSVFGFVVPQNIVYVN
jgi:hypothetical protein